MPFEFDDYPPQPPERMVPDPATGARSFPDRGTPPWASVPLGDYPGFPEQMVPDPATGARGYPDRGAAPWGAGFPLPDGGQPRPDQVVTPNRKTYLWFDTGTYMATQPAMAMERAMGKIARSGAQFIDNTRFRAGVGYTLSAYADDMHYYVERDEGQEQMLQPGSGLTVPEGFTGVLMYAAPRESEMPEVTTGASPNLVTAGFRMNQKGVRAADDWDARLVFDQAALPSPDYTGDTLAMDRVATSDEFYGYDRMFVLDVFAGGANHLASDKLCTFYFPGPAGRDNFIGVGYYAVTLRGDGRATLYERGKPRAGGLSEWRAREVFTFAQPGQVFNKRHRLLFLPTAEVSPESGPGGCIHVASASAMWDDVHGKYSTELAIAATGNQIGARAASTLVYKVPNNESSRSVRASKYQLRLDIRRDLRLAFGVGVAKWLASGSLSDDAFVAPSVQTAGENLVLEWDAATFPGATVDLQLYNLRTGAQLSLVESGDSYKVYSPPADLTKVPAYFVRATLASSDGVYSPYLRSIVVRRAAVTQLVEPVEPWSPALLTGYTATGAERDPSTQTCVVNIFDLDASLTRLRRRSRIPVRVETSWDAEDQSKRCVLFRGFSMRANSKRLHGQMKLGGDGQADLEYPSRQAVQVDANCTGEWQRIAEQVFHSQQRTFFDHRLKKPMKASDVVAEILRYCGYGEDQIAITDSPVRLFSQRGDDRMKVEPMASMAETIQSLAKDYLGEHLIFDENAGARGQWRTIVPPVAPYTNVAAFVSSPPDMGDSSVRLSVHHARYPDAESDEDFTYAVGSPTTFVVRGTYSDFVEKPEANLIRVTCIGEVGMNSAPSIYTATLINTKSYDFDPDNPTADPDHPDYLGCVVPLFVVMPSLMGSAFSASQYDNAVNWVARRVYDVSAHAIKVVQFEAPLVLVPHELDSSRRRTLRYYDPCTLDTGSGPQQFLVKSVNPAYTKDSQQFAMYELWSPTV